MSFRNRLACVALAGVFSTGALRAQEIFKSEASVQFMGTFVSSTWYRGVQQTATDSGGVLANYRYFFNDYNGVELNYGFATGTQTYNYFNGSIGTKANTDEATAAWIFRLPNHRVVPFGLLGTGALVFDPSTAPATVQARAMFVYGGGLDIGIGDRYFIRAQYRGLVYNSPDFNTFYLGPDRLTHRAEPSIGFGVKF